MSITNSFFFSSFNNDSALPIFCHNSSDKFQPSSLVSFTVPQCSQLEIGLCHSCTASQDDEEEGDEILEYEEEEGMDGQSQSQSQTQSRSQRSQSQAMTQMDRTQTRAKRGRGKQPAASQKGNGKRKKKAV